MPCSSLGNDSKRKACALASRPPPIKPCITRAKMRTGSEWAMPQSMENPVKPIIAKTK